MSENKVASSSEIPLTTRLALDRTRSAYERTMMAWARTATTFVTFGFTVYKFFEIEMEGRDINPAIIGPREFALFLILTGLLTLLVGRLEHIRDLRSLKKYYPDMPASGTRLMTPLIAVFGAIAFVAVLLKA